MKKLTIYFWILLLWASHTATAQVSRSSVKEANFNYEHGDFRTPLPIFEKLVVAEPANMEARLRLAYCYLNTGLDAKALVHFLKVKAIKPSLDPELDYLIGKACQGSLKFDQAIAAYNDYIKNNAGQPGAGPAQRRIKECEFGKELVEIPVQAEIINMGPVLNSQWSEYAPVITSNEQIMMFTSRREGSTGGDKTNTNEYYEDVYFTEKENGRWISPLNLGTPINAETHDACIALSPDGKKLFLYKDKTEDIFYSTFTNKGWSKPKSMGSNINSKYSELSISITADGKTVYFSSNRPGGFGGLDIYKSVLQKNEEWGPAVNLGNAINTATDEDAPFIMADGQTLYFSSRGHETMGGYDIFISGIEDGGRWSEPSNLGYPINTPSDDIYFVLSADLKHGYYASEKEGGYGGKDIYMISMPQAGQTTQIIAAAVDKIQVEQAATAEISNQAEQTEKKGTPTTILSGTVRDDISKAPLEATLTLVNNSTGEVLSEDKTSATGEYKVVLLSGKNYGIAISKDGYLFHSENFDLPPSADYQEIVKDVDLKKIAVGTRIILKNIFFDFNKAILRKESFIELNRLVDLLNEVPTMKVEISGHTDNVGNATQNQKLSENRAAAVTNYLLRKGQFGGRITYKGYGFSRPIAPNNSEANRQLNRRTEFEIKAN